MDAEVVAISYYKAAGINHSSDVKIESGADRNKLTFCAGEMGFCSATISHPQCPAKSSEKRVDYTETLYSEQSGNLGWPDMDLIWILGCREQKKAKGGEEQKCNRLHYSEWKHHLSISMSLFSPSLPFFSLISPLLGSRGGLNGDTVASWEQHPDAVWVCKAELQHQWFCCQGDDLSSRNVLINVPWKILIDNSVQYVQ